MSIKKYTNFDRINQRLDSEGKFLQDKDLFVISNNQFEESEFGNCESDVMEVSVYDVNNNLLPQKSGKNVAYIKTGDIKNYLYNITSIIGKKELAVDTEKLLEHLGFTNGILRVNINFVRNKVGDDNELRRAWIQQISPSRNEIRILPLKIVDETVTKQNITDFNNLQNLNKEFKFYKRGIMNSLGSFQNNFLDSVTYKLESKYGGDFVKSLRKDFGLRDFNDLETRIYNDFKLAVSYYLDNKYYELGESNFGKPSPMRFDECNQYDFEPIIEEIKKILFKSIEINTTFLKRRSLNVVETPKEFTQVDLANQIQNVLNVVQTPVKSANIVYTQIEQPTTITPPPPTINVSTTKPTFSYLLKNKSSLRSIVFTFTDASGQSVQKTLGAGKDITVCAQEDTISANQTQGLTKSKKNPKRVGEISDDPNPPKEYLITKLGGCNTIDIGIGAPIPKPKDIEQIPRPKTILETPIKPIQTTTQPKVYTTTTNTTSGTKTTTATNNQME